MLKGRLVSHPNLEKPIHHVRLVSAIFVLSGAAGLIYEIVWARQLVLVFGNTTQAVSAILTGFFGGMAIGSVIGGRLADRVKSPLRLYGILEVALVVVVLATPLTFQLIHELYRGAFSSLEGQPQVLALLRFGLSLLALGPATVMMGATLPTLTRHLSRGEHLSGAFGRLYALNTTGAIIGTLLAGIVLIEALGLTGALLVGALCSGIAGLVAIVLARSDDRAAEDQRGVEHRSPTHVLSGTRAAPTLALIVAFVSGLTSLGYQTLWTRLLATGTGSSTYVFTIILALFLIGITLGAMLFGTFRRRISDWILVLAVAQVLVAILALAGLVFVISRPLSPTSFAFSEVFRLLLSSAIVVVLPATIVLGIAFPASSSLLEDRDGRVATAAGQLLAVNTLGAICGTFLIPFFVIPLIGSPHAIVLLALINAATALALAAVRLKGTVRGFVSVAAAATAVAIVGSLLTPGLIQDPTEYRVTAANGTIERAAEDEIAAVQAGQINGNQQLWVAGTSMTLLTIDARLMPILPLMARPDADRALTVAFGMGSAFRTALIAGLETDAVELVPSVPGMFGVFYPDAEQVFADPRGKVIVADGRNHVELTDQRYDIIVTDPPPPIESAGVSVISSYEYYQAGHDRLTEGGVMMQWMPYGSTLEEYKAHLRSFRRVFPHMSLAYGPGGYGFFLMGSDQPMELTEEAMRDVLERPGVLEDISSAYDTPPSAKSVDGWIELIPRLFLGKDEQIDRFVGDGPLITDDRPLPEYFLLRQWGGSQAPMIGLNELRRQLQGG